MEAARWVVDQIGAPASALSAGWVRHLCVLNGVLAAQQYVGQFVEKSRFPTPSGARKVAAFNVMNAKYVGYLRAALFAHVVSGMCAQLGSSLSIFLEERAPRVSRRAARVAAYAEAFVHAPTAFVLTPFVYGDKGITPFVYGTVSFLLQISGLCALRESFKEDEEELEEKREQMEGDGGGENKISAKSNSSRVRVELRRMCTTISIFLYVRLYAIMRGPAGFLRKQKYSLAVMTAGTAMMPVGWSRGVFPAVFWWLMFINRKSAGRTLGLIRKYGVDGAASRQPRLA